MLALLALPKNEDGKQQLPDQFSGLVQAMMVT